MGKREEVSSFNLAYGARGGRSHVSAGRGNRGAPVCSKKGGTFIPLVPQISRTRNDYKRGRGGGGEMGKLPQVLL